MINNKVNKIASKSQRIAAIIIDYVLLYLVVGIICSIVMSFLNLKMPTLTEQLSELIQSGDQVALQNSEEYQKYVTDMMSFGFKTLGIGVLTNIVCSILYFIILPLNWQKQTIGRLITKIKLVNNDNKVLISDLFQRELIGNILIGYVLNFCCCIPFVVNFIMLLSSNQTIADKIASQTYYRRTDIMDDDINEDIIEYNDETIVEVNE